MVEEHGLLRCNAL